MPPLLVGNALHVARREGLLPKLSEKEETTVAKMVPGPGESPPTIQRLDLQRQP